MKSKLPQVERIITTLLPEFEEFLAQTIRNTEILEIRGRHFSKTLKERF